MSSLDFSDILRARQNLRGIVAQPPFQRSAALSQQTNMEIYFNAECPQHTGPFNLRGAYHKIFFSVLMKKPEESSPAQLGTMPTGFVMQQPLQNLRLYLFTGNHLPE